MNFQPVRILIKGTILPLSSPRWFAELSHSWWEPTENGQGAETSLWVHVIAQGWVGLMDVGVKC